ncbi:MAG: Xaa-Pro peptidase family protein [Syntrophales bacterium]|nr:Xaa-Pro peptidase family protein [Syntrophales bacterium]
MEKRERIKKFQRALEDNGIEFAIVGYSRNVFYLTGTSQPSWLLVTPNEYALYVRHGLPFAKEEVFIPLDKVREEKKLKFLLSMIQSKRLTEKTSLGLEMDIITAKDWLTIKNTIPNVNCVNISPLIMDQRKKKDVQEIEAIKRACIAVNAGHGAILNTLKEGITELELAAAIEYAHRLAGHEGIFFIRQPDFFMSRGPLASGENLFRTSGVVQTISGVGLSPAVPAGPSKRKVSKGDVVIVDIPTLVEGYHADQARTYVLGKAKTKIHELFNALREIADYLIDNIKPGIKANAVYRLAVQKAAQVGKEKEFQSLEGGKKAHLVGHGVGLELNEPPILAEHDHSEIGEGAVIALDLHMMDESVGAVKLEDMILVKNHENEIITLSPRVLCEV